MSMLVSTMNSTTMKAYAEALARKARTISAGGDFKDLLKLDQDTGAITFGQENVQLHDDDVIAIHPGTIRHGFVAFGRNEIATTVDGESAEVSVSILEDLPDYDDLPELEQPKGKPPKGKKITPIEWKPFVSIEGTVISGPNEGLEFSYKPTSFGGHKAVKSLMEEISKRMAAGDSEVIPICLLSSDFYFNKTWNKDVYYVVIDIESWMSFDEAEKTAVKGKKSKTTVPAKGAKKLAKQVEEDDDADEEDEKPIRSKGRSAKTVASVKSTKKPVKQVEEDDDEDEDEEDEKPVRSKGRSAKTSFLKNRPAPQVEDDEEDDDDADEEDEEDTDAQYTKRKGRVVSSSRRK